MTALRCHSSQSGCAVLNPASQQTIARTAPGGQPRLQAGFSLVELVVTMSIAAILMVIAIPSFQWLLNSSRLTAPANEMVASMQVARMEAIRRNSRAVLCRSDNADAGAAATCSAAGGTWPGWIVFVDNGDNGTGTIVVANNRNGQRDAGETLLRSGVVNAPLEMRVSPAISAQLNRVVFRSEGFARPAPAAAALEGIVSVCLPTAQPAENIREVRLVAGSRVSISRFDGGALCAVPPDTR